MQTNLERYRKDLAELIFRGEEMKLDLNIQAIERERALTKKLKDAKVKVQGKFGDEYQMWYSQATAVLMQVLPTRLSEFESLYSPDAKRKTVGVMSYAIQDWLVGMRASPDRFTGEKPFDDLGVVLSRFSVQLDILKSVQTRFESTLFDIRQLVQADLFDSELDAARELYKNGFMRAAGVVAGVVLERHLGQVCQNHQLVIRKKHPTIADLNDALKNKDVVDVPAWRFTQRLGDLRNLCGHSKEREPTKDEVVELIDGVEKVSKTLF